VNPTPIIVTCERYREAASARLDGEPLQISAASLDHHMQSCPDCAAWLATAQRVSRSFRVSGDTPSDLVDSVMARAVLPTARVTRYRRRLRLGLALIGLVQWALALPLLFGQSVGMALPLHASHESAAWNLALGAAFLAVAVKPGRASGTLPILATFVAVLAVFSVSDLAADQVDPTRLASHLGVLAGLVLVVLTARSEGLLPGGVAQDANRPTGAVHPARHSRGQGAA
jgi:predicted anti-sigma-YlaC factor YlaD